ncbi:hypothetical protein PQR37_18670 [Paraburkholderia nemoris]|uniref:hypothetical protein n=1 Tax=Paraburkholderia nemoris TaxID=2793076 RepID=UPI0038B760DB
MSRAPLAHGCVAAGTGTGIDKAAIDVAIGAVKARITIRREHPSTQSPDPLFRLVESALAAIAAYPDAVALYVVPGRCFFSGVSA